MCQVVWVLDNRLKMAMNVSWDLFESETEEPAARARAPACPWQEGAELEIIRLTSPYKLTIWPQGSRETDKKSLNRGEGPKN